MAISHAAFFVAVMFGGVISARPAGGGQQAGVDERARIEGVWRGHSVCEDKKSACHDEVNVYRFTAVAGKAHVFMVTASKVVNGNEVAMGSSEFKYDEKANAVECGAPAIRMVVAGKKMEGALRREDGAVYRRIYLEKQD